MLTDSQKNNLLRLRDAALARILKRRLGKGERQRLRLARLKGFAQGMDDRLAREAGKSN